MRARANSKRKSGRAEQVLFQPEKLAFQLKTTVSVSILSLDSAFVDAVVPECISGCIAPVVCSFLSTTAQLYATHRKGGERRKRHPNSTRE